MAVLPKGTGARVGVGKGPAVGACTVRAISVGIDGTWGANRSLSGESRGGQGASSRVGLPFTIYQQAQHILVVQWALKAHKEMMVASTAAKHYILMKSPFVIQNLGCSPNSHLE